MMFGTCDSMATMLRTRSSMRREIAFDVNVQVGRAGVNHRIALKDRHVLALKDFAPDRRLKNSEIDRLTLAQLIQIKLLQPIIEAFQPRQFSIERQPAVIGDSSIVLVQTERSGRAAAGRRNSL